MAKKQMDIERLMHILSVVVLTIVTIGVGELFTMGTFTSAPILGLLGESFLMIIGYVVIGGAALNAWMMLSKK